MSLNTMQFSILQFSKLRDISFIHHIFKCLINIKNYKHKSSLMLLQISKKNGVTLNPRQGERAVLIKNNEGDWGIVIGHWEGYTRVVERKFCLNIHFRFYNIIFNRHVFMHLYFISREWKRSKCFYLYTFRPFSLSPLDIVYKSHWHSKE